MESVSTIQDEVSKAWGLRLSRRLDACRLKVVGIESTAVEIPTTSRLDLEVLRASLKRAENRWRDAEASLTRIENSFPQASSSFYWNYERAYLMFNRGEYSQALDQFLAAFHATGEPTLKGVALINAMGCFDSLGLPFIAVDSELQGLLPKVQPGEIKDLIENMIQFIKAHGLFRAGDIAGLERFLIKRKKTDFDQLSYFFDWVSQIPYLSSYRPIKERSYGKDPGIYHGIQQFRLRTLRGLVHPDDENITNPFEFADRAYLWVWRWLVDPNPHTFERLLPILRRLISECNTHHLTAEDSKLVKNALLWLSLFDVGASQSQVYRLVKRLSQSGETPMPILDFEGVFVQWLLALRDRKKTKAEDYLKCMKDHPLWKSESFLLPRIAEAIGGRPAKVSKRLIEFFNRLTALVGNDRVTARARVVVNLLRTEINDKGRNRKTISHALTRALELFHSHESIPCGELLECCFGIAQYEPDIHNRKIFNLMGRLRELAGPDLSFHMKNGVLYSRGKWDGILFIGKNEFGDSGTGLRTLFAPSIDLKVPLPRRIPLKARHVVPGHLTKGSLTRREIESTLKVPRSTANRVILEWLQQGTLARHGKGKKTIYTIQKTLRPATKEGNIL